MAPRASTEGDAAVTREEIVAVASEIMSRNDVELRKAVETVGASLRARIVAMADADSMTPEGMAQKTIENLSRGGVLSSRTVEQVKTAADKAASDVAVNRAFGRR